MGVCKLSNVGPEKGIQVLWKRSKCLLAAEWEWVHLHVLPQICLFSWYSRERERDMFKSLALPGGAYQEKGCCCRLHFLGLVRSVNSYHMALSLLKEMPLFNPRKTCYCL